MPHQVTLYNPSTNSRITEDDVVDSTTHWGDENTITLEKDDGTTETHNGNGLCIVSTSE
jgi:hypothetical protein